MKRLGMIGAGAIAHVHLERWQQLPVQIAGFYDIRPSAAEQASARFGGRAYATLDELLNDVDIVDICTTSDAHRENVLATAAAGKPMVCEKPLARHVRHCQEMVDVCASAGVPLFVAHVVRFFPQYVRAKEVLDSGVLGRPGVVRTVRGGSFPRPVTGFGFSSGYYADFSLSGGVILDVSIHDIDYLRWCCGEVERVFARGLTFAGETARDHALITLRFSGGAIGHVEGSWAFPPGDFRTRLEIAGDRGILEWDSSRDAPVSVAIQPNPDSRDVSRSTSSPLAAADDPYYAELAHFLDCLGTGQPFRVTPQDGLMAVKISLAAIDSMRLGRPIDVASYEEELL
jgi:UDP-N-acetylglucosamine 3-dehydrogenase